jgi:Zn ribbon nucleic-acid-binding protein
MLAALCQVNGYDYPQIEQNIDGTFNVLRVRDGAVSLIEERECSMTVTVTLTEEGKAFHRRFISTHCPRCPLCGYSDWQATWRREEDGLMHCQRCGGVLLDFNPQLRTGED